MSVALDHLRLMARNNAYANARLYEACCRLNQAELEAERNGFFPSIRDTLNHILEVDRYYVDALEEGGEGLSVYDRPHRGTAAELRQEQEELDRTLIAFCDGLTDAGLGRKIIHDRGGKGIFRETVAATLLHLFQHQIHHRGQVHAMLSGTAVEPPQLDEFFLDFDRHPAAEEYL
jgi:uncharacterized damage-inducible protein DinB